MPDTLLRACLTMEFTAKQRDFTTWLPQSFAKWGAGNGRKSCRPKNIWLAQIILLKIEKHVYVATF